MTTLLVGTLETELVQEINYNLIERVHVGAFIPYLYCHNAIADYFTFQLHGPDGLIFQKPFTISQLKTAIGTTSNYFHIYYPIIPTSPVQLENGQYSVKIIAGTNYIQNANSFLGWVKQHENIQNQMDYAPIDDNSNSYAIRYKCYKEGVL
jgi:hypothetical protein